MIRTMQHFYPTVFRYRAVEEEIVKHSNRCETDFFDFPVPAAVAGASHLYVTHHYDKPWNWTG